ncbi:hypothetical protein HLH33_02500 [Gluconacetobacter diazotrophicus]|uniref:Ig-like domain-containing protein n=1 Tax=Gluconacetobacter diazotrophicus TaxID=33996 RepID=A0A7W4FCK7_GLUDI|nr:glycoside hydrolase family 66 protein [Gluconacetobacter diazotrophicus]MBB2155188.1 hypothetical protein [Gluconacetobacter diazotrophicus]
MMKSIFALLAILVCGSAHAASLSGPLIKHVTDDKAFYKAGAPATVTIALTNGTGSAFTGNIDAMLCTSRGTAVGFQQMPVSGLAAGASTTVAWTLNLPLLNVHSFYLSIVAVNSADSGGVSCTGTGSTSSSPVDVASGALNIAASAWEDPIEAFVDAPTLTSTTITAQQVAANLAQYHIGLIQGYDLLSRHDAPYPTGSSWKNLAGATLTSAEVSAYASAFHGYGMKFLAYSLWNGAWSDYLTADPNVSLSMGLFTSACGVSGGVCALAEQLSTGVGAGWPSWGWSSNGLYEMNPANGRWMTYLASQFQSVLSLGFDGIHLDTLGDPGVAAYDVKGRLVNGLGSDIAPFANYVQSALGVCTDINQVSGWNLQDEAVRGQSCNLYIEPHPEFGNYPFYPSLNGLVEQMFEWTGRPLITAFYPQQVMSGVLDLSYAVNNEPVTVCDPSVQGSSACPANDSGIELLLGQIAASGASQLMLGDLDHLTPGPFFPRASLGIDANLQEYLADYYNWFVGFRDLLRGHSVDATDVINVTNGAGTDIGSSTGAAGSVYYRAWTRAGIAGGISLTNLVGLADNRIDDPDGKHNPTEQTNLKVISEIYGNQTPGVLWYSAPDVNHGFPQQLTYTLGDTTTNNGLTVRNVTFTVPDLKTVGIAWVEGSNLSTARDWTVNASDFIRGGTPAWSPNGMGASAAATVHGCCGRAIYWDNIDLGASGVTSLSAVTYSQYGAPIEFHADTENGQLLATVNAPASSSGTLNTSTVTVANSPAGVHRIWVKFPDRDVTLYGWQP